MANQSINSLTFISRNHDKLQELYKAFNAVAEQKEGNSICNLMAMHNYTFREVTILCDRRDYISDVDKEVTQKGKSFYFHAETVSAWEPNLLPITTLLNERYGGEIKLVSQSIEEGQGIYQTNDWTGYFYPEKFSVDLCSNENYDTRCFSTWPELITFLEATFPEADISPLDTLDALVAAIQDAYDNGEDESFFINVNRFTEYPDNNYYEYREQRKEAA